MEEDTEFKKLPIEERCIHKLWKARLHGYEEAIKLFREIDDEKSPEWNKFVGLIKKFVIDSHALCQERGLEATLLFVENCANAGKVVGDIIAGIVSKCLAASKTKTRELAVQVILMVVEIEKQEACMDELLKGFEAKNPKTVAACIAAVTQALREFGTKVIMVKGLIKKIPALLSDRDKGVRDETKQLTIEIYKWIGVALKPQLASLTPVVLSELEGEFEKVTDKVYPTRLLKSQQGIVKAKESAGTTDGSNGTVEVVEEEPIDPLELIDAVDILSKLPKDFYTKIEAKKWQERKEALECLEVLLKNPKLENGDYGDLVRALKKVLSKDSNVLLVSMAGKSIALLASGLRKQFSPYAAACFPSILEKFKEKKSNVVTALRDASDAVFAATTFDAVLEDILEALANKNPNMKAETALFLARTAAKSSPTVFNKKLLKTLMVALLKTLNESDPIVRDGSADALGTLSKLLGDKAVAPYLTDVDALKLAKIKEFTEKAVLSGKIVEVKAAPARAAAAAATTTASSARNDGSSTTRKVINSATFKKKPTSRSDAGNAGNSDSKRGGGGTGSGGGQSSASSLPSPERDMQMDEVIEKATELLSSNLLAQLCDANWKTRLAAVEQINDQIPKIDPIPMISQCLIKVICRKPGIKDVNFQVLKIKFEILQKIVSQFGINPLTADLIIPEICERLGDAKNSAEAGQTLSLIAETLNLEYVITNTMTFAFDKQKSPKVQAEAMAWTGQAIKDFGGQVNNRQVMEYIKTSLQSTNLTVRQAGISLFGVLALYEGSLLLNHFDNEKPAIKQQLQAELDKNAGTKPPVPIRGSKSKSLSRESSEVLDKNGDAASTATAPDNSTEIVARIDISSYITESLLTELADKNWKTRYEALLKLQGIVKDAKHIKPSIAELPQSLAQRLVDMNAKVAQTALALCQNLAEALGNGCKQYAKQLFPGFLNGMGDSKPYIRQASVTCIDTWGEQCGYKEFFESEMIADALKSGSPILRAELWTWIAIVLPKVAIKAISKDELHTCLPHLYSNICDRNVDVRKNANDAIYGFMIHLGYENMVKALEKQKPASKKDILAALDKTRPNLPVKPLPKSKQQAPIIDESKPVKSASAKSIKSTNATAKGAANAGSVTSRTKKEEEVDTSPLLAINNLKNQRLIDEQKLKVLKWSFTTPRDEFSDLLKDQMTVACVNKGLMANMFHDDFRYHLKAIELLLDDLEANSKALICNLDLILKWISLRFYDTNPSVLLKGLDYLNLVFSMLLEKEYYLAENESNCFIPHLLIKIGDPKDAVRNSVRNLIRQICLIYPFGKVFCYVMEGLKSKNARQRTECLDELGYLIESYGINVCQPSPQVALKEIAKHISDRDNSVRNAALNSVVQAFFLIGEKIYKFIGHLNEKDLSMLDERIKRAKKTKKSPESGLKSNAGGGEDGDDLQVTQKMDEAEQQPMYMDNDIRSPEPEPQIAVPVAPIVTAVPDIIQRITPPRKKGPFGLDPNVIAEIERDWIKSDQIQIRHMPTDDLTFLDAPLKIGDINGVTYPIEKLNKLIANSMAQVKQQQQPQQQSSSSSSIGYNNINSSPMQKFSHSQQYSGQQYMAAMTAAASTTTTTINASNLAQNLPKLDPNIMRIIQSISNTDTLTARAALNELGEILESPDKQAVLKDYEELYVDSIYTQFKNLSKIPLNESLILYQPVLASTYSFFTSKSLGKNIGIESLKRLMSVLLNLMADQKLGSGDDGQYTKVINGICLRILDRTNFTNLNCALIRLLKETCVSAGLPKFVDLLMKCIWRNVKVMPERTLEIDYDAVLLEIHDFMSTLPSTWWTQRPSDTPLRTVKTIIHNMAKIKGNSILHSLNQIPEHSELHTYLLKVLKNTQRENANTNSPSSNINVGNHHHHHSPRCVSTPLKEYKTPSKHTHDSLSHIFKLISNKETNQDGIQKLYEFKLQNANVDIGPFLKGASPVFQKYIEDSLCEIEKSRRQQSQSQNSLQQSQVLSSFKSIPVTNYSPKNKTDADYWMEKLNYLRGKANMTQPNQE